MARKEKCPDCKMCQGCAESRCRLCRDGRETSCRKALSIAEQLELYNRLNPGLSKRKAPTSS